MVLSWMDKLKEILDTHQFPPELIFNMDETMLEVGGKRVKVITRKDAARPYTEKPPKAEHISLVLTVSAAGAYMRPLCIFPLKTLPPLDPQTQAFYYISGQENGFITKEIFFGWMVTIFIPGVHQIRANLGDPGRKALLLVDGHSTCDFEPALAECEANNIMVFTFLGHSSTISQPLDLEPNNEFKRALNNHFRPKHGESKTDMRVRLLNISVKCLQIALCGLYIQTSFAKAGIWPYSREAPLKSSLVHDPNDLPAPQPQKKRRRGPRISGRILVGGQDITPSLPAPYQYLPPPPTYPTLPYAADQEQSEMPTHDYLIRFVDE